MADEFDPAVRRQRKLVEAVTLNEFGEPDPTPQNEYEMLARDATYVPGFSDMKKKRDEAVADLVHGRLDDPGAVKPLPVNLRWVRAYDVRSHEPDTTKMLSSDGKGYRPVNASQIGKVPWLTAMPPGAKKLPDGSIAKGDTILVVAEAGAVARNRQVQRGMVEDQLAAVGSAVQQQAGYYGTDASVSKTLGRPIEVGQGAKQ